jgi:predicted nucleotidyltransferase component of viral defense system
LIGARELAAWRTHAPWTSDVLVEQDYLLSKSVAAIFEDNFLKAHVAMRGGTVLHKGHLAPASRYSEDIDLVLVTDRDPRHIRLALHRVLKPLLNDPFESIVTDMLLAVRNLASKSKIIRTTFVYDPSSDEATFSRLKVEVNINESRSLYPLVPIEIDVPDEASGTRKVTVTSYDLDEMLGTKLRALLQREHGRDLFDLWSAWKGSQTQQSRTPVDPRRVGAAFRFYMDQEGSTFKAAEVRQELERRMSSRKFRNDMNGYLPAGHVYSPEQACEEFFDVYLPHLDA